jgi:hypothetical protein
MFRLCGETAYYLNAALPQLALIAKGVRVPAGQWIRIASERIPAALDDLVRDLFPRLRRRFVPFVVLLTNFDVEEFERARGVTT